MSLAYRFAIIVVRTFARLTGHKTIRVGSHRIPAGGAVLAINHTSYVDFLFAGESIHTVDGRTINFMGKVELRKNPILRFFMDRCEAITVDRSLGHDAYLEAVQALRRGALVGVFAEATISRSFEIKSLKSGAARMALEAGVPIVPVIVWGSQRIATKGQPLTLGRTKTPVVVAVGPPLPPDGDTASLTADLHRQMNDLLHQAQEEYGAHPAGQPWVPARLGGSAPTLAEADALDEAEKDEKERIRAQMRSKKRR